MTYNEQLQSNNTDLQALLDAVEALPEAKPDPVLQNKTVTPGTADQTVTADSGYDGLGTVTVQGDADLKAANIASGVSIFGVTGSLQAGAKVATGSVTTNSTQKTFEFSPGFIVKNFMAYIEKTAYIRFINGSGRTSSSNLNSGETYSIRMSSKNDKTVFTVTNTYGYFGTGTWEWIATS